MKELRFRNEKNSDIRDYQHKVLIQREMEVNGMWIIVNVEKTLSPPPPHAYPGSVSRTVSRSLSIYDLFSSPLLAPFFGLFRPPFQAPSARFVQRSVPRSLPRSVPRSVPSFILFIVDKRTLSSIFWSLLTIAEQVVHHWSHTDAQG